MTYNDKKRMEKSEVVPHEFPKRSDEDLTHPHPREPPDSIGPPIFHRHSLIDVLDIKTPNLIMTRRHPLWRAKANGLV